MSGSILSESQVSLEEQNCFRELRSTCALMCCYTLTEQVILINRLGTANSVQMSTNSCFLNNIWVPVKNYQK